MKEQKVITITSNSGGAYYNFFYTPGSIDSLQQLIEAGWKILLIKDNPSAEKVVCVFEREVCYDPR